MRRMGFTVLGLSAGFAALLAGYAGLNALQDRPAVAAPSPDPKSTRLNSSH